MKKCLFVIFALLMSFCLKANHWQPNPYQFEHNMISIGVVLIDGVEQTVDSLEVGAFHDGDCRGSALTTYNESYDRFFVFMMLYGNEGDSLDFKIYDHRDDIELDVKSLSVIVFNSDGQEGTAGEPFIFGFETELPPVQEYEVSVVVSPDETAVAAGAGVYEEGSVCTVSVTPNEHWFFENWTVGDEVVSTEMEYSFAVTEDIELTANLYYYNKVSEAETTFIELYPNPVSDYLIIKNAQCMRSNLVMFDLNGRIVFTKTLFDNEVVDMRNLANGAYLVVIDGKAWKVVKE